VSAHYATTKYSPKFEQIKYLDYRGILTEVRKGFGFLTDAKNPLKLALLQQSDNVLK